MTRSCGQPLQGLRVLEFSHVVAGPYAGLQLQLLGAEVTKVERPGGGDLLAQLPHGQRAYAALNGGKRVVELDLAQAQGLSEALELAAHADVLIDSFSPGALARKGLDYAALSVRNPGLIYCSLSGYGTLHEPWGSRPAYDHVVQAMTGMAMLSGVEGDPPIKVGFPLIDAATGLATVSAVLAALRERERERCGRGQFVEVSMARAALQLMFPMAIEALSRGTDAPRIGNGGYTGSPGARYFASADGWLALGSNTSEQMQRAAHALGVDPATEADDAALAARVAEVLRTLPAREAERRLVLARVPAARVRTLAEFLREAVDVGWLDVARSGGDADASRALAQAWRTSGTTTDRSPDEDAHH